jgi:hypothetical protein
MLLLLLLLLLHRCYSCCKYIVASAITAAAAPATAISGGYASTMNPSTYHITDDNSSGDAVADFDADIDDGDDGYDDERGEVRLWW